MVQTTEVRVGHDAANHLNSTRRRCILVQGSVRASIIVISLVRSKQVAQVSLAEHHHLIKAVPSDRPDEPLRMSILPWRARRGRPIPDTHRTKPPDQDVAISPIPIANDVSWCLRPGACLGELASDPFGSRMRGYT